MNNHAASSGRLAFIDWTRGLAALVMLQGHTFHSFTRNDLRTHQPYLWSQFLGGMPPAVFLFLTGITFAFLMHSQCRQGVTIWKRIVAALKRSRYLFLIAFLFRLQLYVFGFPTSPASEILRVDILNCMGMAMLLFAPMAAFSTYERVKVCSILGVAVAALSPLVSMIDPNTVPWAIRAYFFPSYAYFGFFPWASFLAFGMAAGSVLRLVEKSAMERLMLGTLLLGLALVFTTRYVANLPYSPYSRSEFWLNSPALIFIKLGVVLIVLAVAFLWVNIGASGNNWSLLRQIGTTSLLVYWVHIELVYGRWFGFWKESLSESQVLIFTALLIALMAWLSILQTRYRSGGAFFRSAPLTQARATSGD
jgi:uncharacterized membrane protein